MAIGIPIKLNKEVRVVTVGGICIRLFVDTLVKRNGTGRFSSGAGFYEVCHFVVVL